jgi:hypothetical protein
MRPAHASKFSTSELAELLEPIRVYGEEDNQLHPEHINLVTMVAVPRFLKQVVARVHQVRERESPIAIASDIATICQTKLILVLLERPFKSSPMVSKASIGSKVAPSGAIGRKMASGSGCR